MTLTDSKLRTFATSTPAQEAVGVLIATRVAAEAMDARVASIVAPLLESAQLMTSRSPRDSRPNSVITNEHDLYLCLCLCRDDDGCKRYYTAKDSALRAAGFDVPAGYCPALIADSDRVSAENTLLELADTQMGTPLSKTYGADRTKALGLLIGLVAAA